MQTDPYAELFHLMASSRGDVGIHLLLGTVKTPEPLLVDVGGTDQEAERFYICDRLRRGHQETVSLQGGSGGFTANSGTHGVSLDSGTLSITSTVMSQTVPVLKVGDRVLLLTEDFQTFFLIDKVVHL